MTIRTTTINNKKRIEWKSLREKVKSGLMSNKKKKYTSHLAQCYLSKDTFYMSEMEGGHEYRVRTPTHSSDVIPYSSFDDDKQHMNKMN